MPKNYFVFDLHEQEDETAESSTARVVHAEGDSRIVAMAMRAAADLLDPPKPATRSRAKEVGEEFAESLLTEMFGPKTKTVPPRSPLRDPGHR